MTNTVFTIQSSLTSSDSTLPTLYRDKLIDGALNDGVRFIADFGFGYSYPGGPLATRPAPPAVTINNAAVYDVSGHNDGFMKITSGATIPFTSGNGLDFSGATTLAGTFSAGALNGNALIIPAPVFNDIWTAYSGNSQYFLTCIYIKLPTQANWATNLDMIFQNTDFAGSYIQGLAAFGIQGNTTTPQIVTYRDAGGSARTIITNINTADCGQFAQLAVWRNPSGEGITLRTARARTTATNSLGAASTLNWTGQTGKFGVSGSYWGGGVPDNGKNFTAYRIFIENLARSGRDPLTVLEADWLRVVARNIFS